MATAIIDIIKDLQHQGLSNEEVIQEITKQYPEKGKVINEALKRNVAAEKIIREIIRQNTPVSPSVLTQTENELTQEKNPPEEELPDKTEGGISQLNAILEAKKRIDDLNAQGIPKAEDILQPETAPVLENEELVAEAPDKILESKTENPVEETKEEALDEFLKRKIASEGVPREKSEEEQKDAIPTPPGGQTAQETQELGENINEPLPKKQGWFKRFLIRLSIFIFVLAILASIGTFWYYYFILPSSQLSCSSNSTCATGFICVSGACTALPESCFTDKNCPQNYSCQNRVCKIKGPQINASSPLFPVEDTIFVNIASSDKPENSLLWRTQEWINADTFKRIVFVTGNPGAEISVKDLFFTMQIKMPDNFFSSMEDNFTFFAYSQTQGTRIGFAAKIKDYDNLNKLLKSKEKTIDVDFNPLFQLIANGAPLTNGGIFKDASAVKGYAGPNFRYRMLNPNDIGFYYLLTSDKNYFIFTTSWKSMEKVIERMTAQSQ